MDYSPSAAKVASDGTLTSACVSGTNSDNQIEYCHKALAASYDDIELIGSGSFGQVLKARHRATGRDVAIKILKQMGQSSY